MRNFLAILLILIGILGIACGVRGFSLQADSQTPEMLARAAGAVLDFTGDTFTAVDSWLSDISGEKIKLLDSLNDLVGKRVDLTSATNLSRFMGKHALRLLLGGIVGIETGLLFFKRRR